MFDSNSNSDKLEEFSFLDMHKPFSEITLVVLNIWFVFTQAKSLKCPIDFLYIRHFKPKRHNAGLESYNLSYHTREVFIVSNLFGQNIVCAISFKSSTNYVISLGFENLKSIVPFLRTGFSRTNIVILKKSEIKKKCN